MRLIVERAREAVFVLVAAMIFGIAPSSQAEEPISHHAGQARDACGLPPRGGKDTLDSVQIETSDLKSFEIFLGDVLKAPLIERRDHPGKDSVRGYCYRGVRIIIRRDHTLPRPTGWVQINFTVSDAGVVQREFETAIKNSPVASLDETERAGIIRVRLKPGVRRGDRKAIRLEVSGPEGFMIGFNQYQEQAGQ